MRLATLLILSALSGAVGCGGAGSEGSTVLIDSDAPAEVTDANFPEALRLYFSLPLDHDERPVLKERLEHYLAQRNESLVERNDYSAMVGQFALLTSLSTPVDFAEHRASDALEVPARYLLERGSPRGDEARVLSALTVLSALGDREASEAQYQEIAEWGRAARSSVAGDLERYSRLIDVWEEHTRLAPLPAALDTLSQLYVERRDSIARLLSRDGPQMQLPSVEDFAELRVAPVLLQRAPLDVAAIYLRHGDLASAVARVTAMGDVSGTEVRLARLIEEAREGGDTGAEALLEIATAYRAARPDVTLGLCRYGHRREPSDPRYPLCLARVAAQTEDLANATAWYAATLRLAPDEREIYDEALERIHAFIESGLFSSDPTTARGLVSQAEEILDEYRRRWPEAEPPVAPARFHFLVGMLELNAGQAEDASRRFEQSLTLHESPDALVWLGRLALVAGNAGEAARRFRRALDLTPQQDRGAGAARADTLQLLGDAFREQGNQAEAERMYREALAIWDALPEGMRGDARSEVDVRRGVLLDRLGDREGAGRAFESAMVASPASREVYAKILSHLVVAEPNAALASSVFQRAQRETMLEPEWKVYFALWVKLIAARAGQPPDEGVQALLHELSQGDGWWGRLARFGLGDLPYDRLLAEASGVGEQVEAQFYEGARLLGSGDPDGAQRMFRHVLDSHMLNFFEFNMAQELIQR